MKIYIHLCIFLSVMFAFPVQAEENFDYIALRDGVSGCVAVRMGPSTDFNLMEWICSDLIYSKPYLKKVDEVGGWFIVLGGKHNAPDYKYGYVKKDLFTKADPAQDGYTFMVGRDYSLLGQRIKIHREPDLKSRAVSLIPVRRFVRFGVRIAYKTHNFVAVEEIDSPERLAFVYKDYYFDNNAELTEFGHTLFARNNVPGLYVREGPDIKTEITGKVLWKGTIFEVLAQKGDWLCVRDPTGSIVKPFTDPSSGVAPSFLGKGWVNKRYVDF